MKKNVFKLIAMLISIAGTLLAIYFGGYVFLVKPVRFLYMGVVNKSITTRGLIISIVKIFLASTVAGSIWSICDIIAGKFRDAAENFRFK
ncbi:MAG: hypothetical protein II472_03130 [Lachnospiraceae bacterium]|nr:hypothetical protein [Lachnospiraceae bacterium]